MFFFCKIKDISLYYTIPYRCHFVLKTFLYRKHFFIEHKSLLTVFRYRRHFFIEYMSFWKAFDKAYISLSNANPLNGFGTYSKLFIGLIKGKGKGKGLQSFIRTARKTSHGRRSVYFITSKK